MMQLKVFFYSSPAILSEQQSTCLVTSEREKKELKLCLPTLFREIKVNVKDEARKR